MSSAPTVIIGSIKLVCNIEICEVSASAPFRKSKCSQFVCFLCSHRSSPWIEGCVVLLITACSAILQNQLFVVMVARFVTMPNMDLELNRLTSHHALVHTHLLELKHTMFRCWRSAQSRLQRLCSQRGYEVILFFLVEYTGTFRRTSHSASWLNRITTSPAQTYWPKIRTRRTSWLGLNCYGDWID